MDDLSAYYSHYNLPLIVPLPSLGLVPILINPSHSLYLPTHSSIGARDEVWTLFVAGLPEDVKPREIYNVFREFPGYETSHLPFSFAVFYDLQSAVAVMHDLNGMVFDLETHFTLYIDLAKSNPKSKRSRTGKCHGFLKLKIQGTYGTPVAFVDFQDINCSSEALHALQGTVLYSSLTGVGLRLQYARSRMGMCKKIN